MRARIGVGKILRVFDFDGTLYNGDSSVDFFLYELFRGRVGVKKIFYFFAVLIKKVLGAATTKDLKSALFSFVVKRAEKNLLFSDLKDFWKKHKSKLRADLLKEGAGESIVITASPDFLVRGGCEILKIKCLIATKLNLKTGKIDGENCKGEEKVRLFDAAFKGRVIDRFYTDSISDRPLIKKAKKAFFIKGKKIIEIKDKE